MLRFCLVGLLGLTYAHSKDTGENEVMDWVIPYRKGRVYVTMLGHLWKGKPDKAMRCIGFQTMLIRGCQWAATDEVTCPVPEDFPTATEIRLIGQPDGATSPNEGTVAGSTGPRSTAAPCLLYSCLPKGPYKFNVQKCTLQLVP